MHHLIQYVLFYLSHQLHGHCFQYGICFMLVLQQIALPYKNLTKFHIYTGKFTLSKPTLKEKIWKYMRQENNISARNRHFGVS